jgi:hypothetical protein
MGSERCIERDGALLGQRRSGAMVDGGRSHQADSAVAVFVVVPGEELLAVSASVLDRAGGACAKAYRWSPKKG